MKLKRIAILLVACAAAATVALAGEIFGTITEGSGPAPAGTEVSIKCGDKAYPAVKTDKSGAYHLVTTESGKCTLSVKRGASSGSLSIASYDDPVQCDVVLETKDGALSVRRK